VLVGGDVVADAPVAGLDKESPGRLIHALECSHRSMAEAGGGLADGEQHALQVGR
jgi:hypothetical protein